MRLPALSLLLCFLLAPPLSAAAPPRVMLPTLYASGIEVGDYWISEKFDGVRGRWDGHRLVTRSGLAIMPPAWFIARWPAQPMDGELWIGHGRFEQVSDLVRAPSPDPTAWRRVQFMVFDLPDDPGRFESRVLHMRTLLHAAGIAWLRPVPPVAKASCCIIATRAIASAAAKTC